MTNLKLNIIFITNMVIMLMNACRSFTNSLERQANYVEMKDQEESTVLLTYKGESEKRNTWYNVWF